jgi:hypothetical protein
MKRIVFDIGQITIDGSLLRRADRALFRTALEQELQRLAMDHGVAHADTATVPHRDGTVRAKDGERAPSLGRNVAQAVFAALGNSAPAATHGSADRSGKS